MARRNTTWRKSWIAALVLAAVLLPQAATAKVPADRVTIEGAPIDVARAGADGLLLNPWAGQFLGPELDAMPSEVDGVEPRDVAFWMDAPGEPRLIYAFEHYAAGDSAYIRLPERGEELHTVNQGTIIRNAGWYRASEPWSELVVGHSGAGGGGRSSIVPLLLLAALAAASLAYAMWRTPRLPRRSAR